jgi:hypothetical protein
VPLGISYIQAKPFLLAKTFRNKAAIMYIQVPEDQALEWETTLIFFSVTLILYLSFLYVCKYVIRAEALKPSEKFLMYVH